MSKKKKEQAVATDLEGLKGFLNSKYGEGVVIHGSQNIVDVSVFPTGVAEIDYALGVGGLPRGRIMEIFGAESSGKTTTCLQIIAACQKHYFEDKKRNGVVAFIDAEHALDPSWARKIGVNFDDVLLSQPNGGEEALNICEAMAKSGAIDLIVVDSVAALVPKAELEGEIGDNVIGAQARMMSQGLRKIAGVTNQTLTTVIFVNQIREKIGVMFGSPETTPGGRALKFYSSVRGQISKGSAVKEGDVVVGFEPTIKFIKNKVAPPFTTAKYMICAGTKERPVFGIDLVDSLITTALKVDVLNRNGNFIRYGEEVLGNGLAKASAVLRDQPELFEEIRAKTYEIAFSGSSTNIEQDDSFDVDEEIINAE